MLESGQRTVMGLPVAQGLYDPANEHDSCGVGFLVNLHGRPTHELVIRSIDVLKNLLHRGAVGGDQRTGVGLTGHGRRWTDHALRRRLRAAA